MLKVGCALAVLAVVACAMGGAPSQSDANVKRDAAAHFDAHNVLPGDATMQHDAGVHPLDAFVPQDAGAFCIDNTGCTAPGTCCYFLQCETGTGVGSNLCFP